jgi:type IV pilus assembly protein PilA
MAKSVRRRPRSAFGFTILELMITLAVVGLLSAIALPVFRIYQLRSKSAEAKTNLGSLRVLEESYFSVHDEFLTAAPAPPVVPGAVAVTFIPNAAFTTLGFSPEGRVYFSYGVTAAADGSGYTADAAADIDADGFPQLWGFAKPDASGALSAGQVGCPVAALGVEIGPCGPGHGKSVF